MCLSSGSMAKKLFQGINDCLAGHRIPWENCVAFSVDNTNVNMGKNNSILTRVKQQNPSVYFNGCQCHVVHNTSAAAAKAFNAVIGFDDVVVLAQKIHLCNKGCLQENHILDRSLK